MFTALASLANRRSKRVVVAAVAIFVTAAVLGGNVADRLGPYGADDPATESVRANRLIERGGVQPGVDLVALGAKDARLDRLAAELRREPAVGRVVTWHQGGRNLVSKDGRSAYVAVSFKSGTDDGDEAELLARRYGSRPGVTLGGHALAEYQVNQQVSKDLRRAELLAFPLLFLLSLVFFRSVVAALLPLMVGGLSIVLTFLGLRVASEVGSISVFALNLVTGLGLGLAIDYSLFIVSRYREELARTGVPSEAVRRTLDTAGRTVLFSSLTVTAALASLLVFPQKFLYSMGLGGMMVSLIAASVALVVLPAVLALLGPRVNALAPKRLQRAAGRDAEAAQSGAWYRLSRTVMRRPAPIAITSAAVLVVLGLPFLGIKFISIDASVLPHSASARQVDVALKRDFPPGRTSPVYVAAETPTGARAAAYAKRLERLPGVDSVGPPQPAGRGVTVLNVYPGAGLLSDRSQDAVRDIRALGPPFTALAGGETAHFVDLKQSLVDHMPAALLIIVAATLAVLFLMTGSVVLPLKALLMNVLTLSATFGLLVFVFQDGRLESLLGYTSQGALEATQPIVLVALAFGLSTDYGVFLLSRIKEARDHGAPNREAVASGLERTGRIVTAAALLFCVAIGAFATSEIIFIKEVGIGTALAVLIDATIVRALLVPSLMEMLGRWNWWSPRPLRHLHERLGWSEGTAVSAGRAASAAPTEPTSGARSP
jgi:uncharacterized membrane protein YdfJ with MMPL/SSD domain